VFVNFVVGGTDEVLIVDLKLAAYEYFDGNVS
jgi:hypothetical protein